jgi:regulator of protease activity HflC (stomatin/prohibitin superfamily)
MSSSTILIIALAVVVIGIYLLAKKEDGVIQRRSGQVKNDVEDEYKQNNVKKLYLYASALIVGTLIVLVVYLFQANSAETLFTAPSLFANEVQVTYGVFKWFLLLFTVLYLWRTLVTLYPDEQAVILLFGRQLFGIGSGLFPVWAGFCNLVYGPTKRQQREFPADFANIWHGSTETTPPGKVEPFRITTGGKDNLSENDSPLDGRLTLNVAFFAAFRVVNMPLIVKVLGITDQMDVNNMPTGRLTVDIEEGFRQIQDTAKRVLNALFGTQSPRWIIENQTAIAEELVRRGEYRWGVDLEEVALSLVGLSHTLNTALASVPTAIKDAQASVAKGQGDARVLFLKGEQEANVRRLKLEADAIGIESLAEKLGLKGDTDALTALINAKLAESGLDKIGQTGGKIVLVGGGSGAVQNILGLVEGLKGV